jgi:hypothetical protein
MSYSNWTTKESLPELVLLLQEPFVVDAGFLRSAYEAVLALKLDGDAELVTGQFPFFMLQTAGVLVSVTTGGDRYGAVEYREAFPHHDWAAVQSSLGFFDRRRIARHQGWISACLVREQQPSGLDPYVHVGRAVCPFALPEAAVGVVAPALGRVALFSEEHQRLLRAGDIEQIFGI